MPKVEVEAAEIEGAQADRRRRWLAGPIGLACFALVSPAQAQMPAPTGWDQQTLASFQSMTRCLANGLPDISATYVVSAWRSEEMRRAANELDHKSGFCSIRRTSFTTTSDIFQGALAEALYVQLHRAPPALQAGGEARPVTGEFVLSALADCVAARQPVAVDRLLRTAWNSPEERSGIEGLGPGFRACGTADRFPPLVTMIRLRLVLATALYQRLHASGAARPS